MIIEKQSSPHEPRRPLVRRVRQDEPERPNDVWCRRKQDLPLDQGFAHQAEFIIFEIPQPAMHELSRARRGSLGNITLFTEQNLETAAGSIPRDAGSVDAATDDGNVDQPVIPGRGRAGHRALLSLLSRVMASSCSCSARIERWLAGKKTAHLLGRL